MAENAEFRPDVQVAAVAGPRGDVRLAEPLPGTIAWAGTGDLDAALVELPGQPKAPDGFFPFGLAWGDLIGTRPVPVMITGMPEFAAASTGYRIETETTRGEVDPGTYVASDRYAVNLAEGWPGRWQDWKGMSGSAVYSEDGGYLIGVVAWSDKPLEGRRLTAVPVHTLLADEAFRGVLARHIGDIPYAQPIELAPLLSRPQGAGSLGALLRADAALTVFAGREEEIAFLRRWRDPPASPGRDVKVLLITGRGGEGKTRLATEFVSRSAGEGWVGGLLHLGVSPAEVKVAAYPARPLLLVIDYAAAHAAGTVSLVRAILSARSQAPVRLLLLARSAGYWWADLAAELGPELPKLEKEVLSLRPLLAGDALSRDAVFTQTAGSLAPHLATFTGRVAAELQGLAASMPVPDLSDQKFEHALTVQMAALAALLQRADPLPDDSEAVEDTLLRHERKYRDKLATRHDLQDLRQTRDRAVAGAALFGARGPSRIDARQTACRVAAAALAPEIDGQHARQRNLAEWIAGVYPPDAPVPGQHAEYWGQVLPDRLGEFLAVRLLAEEIPAATSNRHPGNTEDGLLESLADCTDNTGMNRALLILSRAAEHDPRAADWISRLVFNRPTVTAPAALHVAAYAENPAPLRNALIQLALHDSGRLNALTRAYFNTLPEFSLRLLDLSLNPPVDFV